MFSTLQLSEEDARLLVRVARWSCVVPAHTVDVAQAAVNARSATAKAFARGHPAVPVAERCSASRSACEGLARSIIGRRPGGELFLSLLSGADHTIPTTLSDLFKKILVSSQDPSPDELALAAAEAGRAIATLRAKSTGFPRVTAFVSCIAFMSIRDEIAGADGRLSFEALRLLYSIVRRAFEESNTSIAIIRGRAAARIFSGSEQPYAAILKFQADVEEVTAA